LNNGFIYSDDNKRYHTFNYHLKHKFGCKVFKVSLNAGFTCPNIDGSKGYGGCSYCSSSGSGDFAGNPADNVLTQFESIKSKMHDKWQNGKYIAYFQAHTNTYAPVCRLKEIFEPVLGLENVVGLSIATRADALPDDVVNYLADLSRRTYLIVELGLQSVFDKTGEYINRCHTYEEFLQGYEKLAEKGINVCVHIINGLPFETHEMMMTTAKELAKLKLHSLKIHSLHIIRGTKIASAYLNGDFKLMTRDEYVNTVCDQLELLPPELIIQRVTGDGDAKQLIAPEWSIKKVCVINEIDKLMQKRNSWQGKRFNII